MLHIGCHLSISKGFEHIGKEASSIGADTFQFFTRNPQGGKAKDIDLADVQKYNEYACQNHFAQIVAHAPYTLNPCSDNNYYNFHPGSHVGQGVQTGVAMIIDLLNRVLKPEQTSMVLLETMSGKGSEVGASFEELAEIIAGVRLKEKLGVCMDTCHVFAAGYDIVNDLDGVMKKFDEIIGLNRLKAIHLNDSLMPFGSHKDRHAKIGEGEIGTEPLIQFVRHEAVRHLPIILETPNDLSGYASEIKLLRARSL